MEVNSDVRYSVLREKSAETSIDLETQNKEIENKIHPSNIELNNSTTIKDIKLVIDDTDIRTVPSINFSTYKKNNFFLKFQKKSLTEKIFISLILILLVLVLILLSILISFKNKLNKTNKYCDTNRCLIVSSSIYKSINKKIDPCDDFYEYACGGWIKKNLIPSGYPRWGTLNLVTYENQLIIKEQLESNLSLPHITEAELKAKLFYRSCMDSKGVIEKLGGKPLMDILKKFVIKDESNRLNVNESFSNLLKFVQINYGLNSLFEFNVLDDDKNSSFSNIEIIQGSLGLDRSFYINNSSDKNIKAIEIYKKTFVNVIELLFDKVDNSTQIIEDLFEFETRIAQIMLPPEKLSNVEIIYSNVKLSDLNGKYATFFDWQNFMNEILKNYDSKEILNSDDSVIVMGLDYFKNLNEIIKEYQEDSIKEKTLKFSIIFHLIRFSLPLLSKEYRNQFTSLGEALTGTNSAERWQTCIEHTDNIFGLGFAITKMFIRASPINIKTEAKKMIKSIKKSFIENFPEIPWMDNQTRLLAEEKVNSVDELIGYPDFIEDENQLNLRYKELEIKEDDYFGNEVRLVQYALKSEIITYRTKVNRAEWEMTSSAVNAYYSPTRNQIVFPSGILQDPFFHPENPMSINYGSIGSVMGHELTHGFDNSGREYDKNGMMHQWWNDKTIENFKKASECMVDQYSKFKVNDNEYLNGNQTLGENIADNGGLRSAYFAYEKWINENGEEKQLPLLKLTHRQLFFVSFAQTWCSKSTADSLHLSLSVDQHSPPKYRVLGSISNSAEFVKAFNCPINSNMNPVNKCKLW